MGSIYVIILGAGKTILWPFHIDRFGGFGDFFGGGMPSFIEPHLPVDGIIPVYRYYSMTSENYPSSICAVNIKQRSV